MTRPAFFSIPARRPTRSAASRPRSAERDRRQRATGACTFSPRAISSTPTTQNVIEGNYIGTDASGMVPMTNHLNDAISIDLSPGNIIGGTVAGAGNVLAAAGDSGVFIYGDYARGPYASAAGTLIAGNIIGLAADGVTATGFGNAYDGIAIDSAPNTTIGGSVAAAQTSSLTTPPTAAKESSSPTLKSPTAPTAPSSRATISAPTSPAPCAGKQCRHRYRRRVVELDRNRRAGRRRRFSRGKPDLGQPHRGDQNQSAAQAVHEARQYPGATQNVVAGNLIGTNATGTAALGNGAAGIQIENGATSNWIGYNTVYGPGNADDRNVISGNVGSGVVLLGAGTSLNTVAGNLIGTDVGGTIAVSNQNDGITVDGASANTIGGTAAHCATSSRATPRAASKSSIPAQPATWSREI